MEVEIAVPVIRTDTEDDKKEKHFVFLCQEAVFRMQSLQFGNFRKKRSLAADGKCQEMSSKEVYGVTTKQTNQVAKKCHFGLSKYLFRYLDVEDKKRGVYKIVIDIVCEI